MRYYIGYEVEVEIEVNDKNESNNGYWYGYGFEDVIKHATILFRTCGKWMCKIKKWKRKTIKRFK